MTTSNALRMGAACLAACLLLALVSVLPPLFTGKLYRWQGILMLALYGGYLVLLVM